MMDEIEDNELLEEIRREEEEVKDFKSLLNKKKVSKWEMDEAFANEA